MAHPRKRKHRTAIRRVSFLDLQPDPASSVADGLQELGDLAFGRGGQTQNGRQQERRHASAGRQTALPQWYDVVSQGRYLHLVGGINRVSALS